jgi:hypothetical protein
MNQNPKVFISYSRDNQIFQEWLGELTTKLLTNSIEITLDPWDPEPDVQITEFLQKAINENDFVLILCTPKYKEKSDQLIEEGEYEGDMMKAEILSKRNQGKLVPILKSGVWMDSAPSWMFGSKFIDLRDTEFYEDNYQYLINYILGKTPKVGKSLKSYPVPWSSAKDKISSEIYDEDQESRKLGYLKYRKKLIIAEKEKAIKDIEEEINEEKKKIKKESGPKSTTPLVGLGCLIWIMGIILIVAYLIRGDVASIIYLLIVGFVSGLVPMIIGARNDIKVLDPMYKEIDNHYQNAMEEIKINYEERLNALEEKIDTYPEDE